VGFGVKLPYSVADPEARTRLRERPGFSEIHTDSDRGREEVQIRLDRELAKKYNISSQSLANVLGIVVRGQEIRGYRTPEGEGDIWMRLQASDRSDLQDLRSIVVGTGPDGGEVTLNQVAKLDVVKTPGSIRREDRRTFTMMFVVYGGEKKEEGKKDRLGSDGATASGPSGKKRKTMSFCSTSCSRSR
jgi:multidrug efflux pump subunit AcrB